MVYTYLYYSRNELDMARLAKDDLWIAHYAKACGYTGAHGMWQYTSTGKVAGVSGNCDCNWAYKDYSTIIKKAGMNGFGKAVTAPTLRDITIKQASAGDINDFKALAERKELKYEIK